MTALSPADAFARARRGAHIIDVLIEERAPKLASSPVWAVVRAPLYRVLDYAKAVRMADAIAPLPGVAALDHVSRDLQLKVTVHGLERIPAAGRAIVVCNHPTGIADGIALFDALRTVRPDLCFYANSDAHRVCAGLSDILIPVEWVEAKRTRERTRETLLLTREAIEAGRLLVIFPSGRLARRRGGVLSDPPWQTSAVSLARRHEAPVVPVHLSGPWSGLFHFFDRFSAELRDMTLFHEFLNKRGRAFSLTVGQAIPPAALDGDPAAVTLKLKAYAEHVLPADPDAGFA